MKAIFNQYRKLFILGGLVLAGLLAWWLVFNVIIFRVVGITPNQADVATSTTRIEIKFTKALDDSIDYNQNLTANKHDIVRLVEVRGKSIYLNLDTLSKDRSYDIALKDIKAKSGEVIPSVSMSFNPRYVPFQNLSKEEQALQLQDTDRGNDEDTLDDHLPYGGLNYRLTGTYETNDAGEDIFVINAEIILSNADVRTDRDGAIAQAKEDIARYFRSIGENIDELLIRYVVIDPTL